MSIENSSWNNRWNLNPHNEYDYNRDERIKHIVNSIPEDVGSIVDIGSGPGLVFKAMKSLPRYSVALDSSSVALDIVSNIKSVKTVNHSLEAGVRLPFNDDEFDMVLCSEVLEHLEKSLRFWILKEIERVAKKYIILTNPCNDDGYSNIVRCSSCCCVYHSVEHVHFFSDNEYKNIFNNFYLSKLLKAGKRYKDSRYFIGLALIFSDWTGNALNGTECKMCGTKIEITSWKKHPASIFFKFINWLLVKFKIIFSLHKPHNYIALYKKK